METSTQLISIKEACRRLGIGRTKFYALRKNGELTGVCRIGGRTLISQIAIDDFVAQRLDVAPLRAPRPRSGEGMQ